LTSEVALIRLLLRRSGSVKEKSGGKTKSGEIVEIKSLNEAQPRGLSEGIFEPVPSVVENTTRNLQPVRREPKSG
jgi:hypothetical protein